MKTALRNALKETALTIPPIAKLYHHRHEIELALGDAAVHIKNLEGQLAVHQLKNADVHFDLETSLPVNALPILDDPFIHWIRNGISGWCPDTNIKIIDECMRHLKAGAVVEIGSFCGLSTSIIAHCLRRYQKQNVLYSVDDWVFEGYFDCSGTISGAFTADDWMEYTQAAFKSAVKLTTKNINHSHIQKNSNNFFEAWHAEAVVNDLQGNNQPLGGPIAFAYIDGDHSYEQSKKDFMNVDQHLVKGGFVFFDDSADNVGFGSKDVADEVGRLPNYKLMTPKLDFVNKCYMKC
jgi:hypothetical protein